MKTSIKITVLLLAFYTYCFADGPTLSDETKILLQQARSQTKSVSAEQLAIMLKDQKIVLLDVRDPDEWTKDGISYDRQVKISRGFLEIKYPKLILDKYSKNDVFVVYCALGPRSIFAAQRFQELGFANVMFLDGGLKAWQAIGKQ